MRSTICVFRTALIAAILGLGGCLVTEQPLLDEQSGRSKPISPGGYQSCAYTDGEADGDCVDMKVTIDAARQYKFAPADDEEDEASFVRFRKIGRRSWLAQFAEDDDDSYFYFIGRRESDGFSMTMLVCEDLPAELRNGLVEQEVMDVEERGVVCVPKTLGAAIAVARAYRDDETIPRSMELRITNPTGQD